MLGIPFLGETANRQVETYQLTVDMSDVSQALDTRLARVFTLLGRLGLGNEVTQDVVLLMDIVPCQIFVVAGYCKSNELRK